MRGAGTDEALVHAAPHQEHRGEGDPRGAEEWNAVTVGDVGQHATDHRADQRADQLTGAEQAQRVAQPPFGHLARHQRHRGGGKAGENPHQRAGCEELPDVLREAHARGEQRDRAARADQHRLGTMAYTYDDVVAENIYTTNMAEFIKVSGFRNSIYKKQFPTGTWLEVKGLAVTGQLIEIDIELPKDKQVLFLAFYFKL